MVQKRLTSRGSSNSVSATAVFDRGVLAVDVTGLLEALEERREEGRITLRHWPLRNPLPASPAVRAGNERPRDRRAAEQRDKGAPF